MLLYDTSLLVSIALCAESFVRGELAHLVQVIAVSRLANVHKTARRSDEFNV